MRRQEELKTHLILNHVIVLYNVFGEAATPLLFYKTEVTYWSQIKAFMLFLNRLPLTLNEDVDEECLKRTEPNLNEMINSAGDGSGLQLPPAFVMVNPKQHRKYKKNNETIDGRSKGARSLFDRIQRRKMKEDTEM